MHRSCAVLALLAVSAAPMAGQRSPSPEYLTPLIDSILRDRMQEERIPGAAVVVVHRGRVAHARGYGLSHLQPETPVDPERTLFRIGSITKLLTALGVMRLVDQGRVGLDDPVDRIVRAPLIQNRYGVPVRVRHLLTHTAGFDQIGDDGRWTFDRADRLAPAQYLTGRLRLIRPPGFAATYDTYGMTLAGVLLEQASGQSYADFMREQVFLPLGMRRTFVEVPDSLRGDLAIGYAWRNDRHEPERYEYYATLPASSIDASAADMGRLMLALLGDGSNTHGRLFSPRTAALVRTVGYAPHPSIPEFSYGFFETRHGARRIIGHGGDMLEYETDLWLVPEDGLGVYVAYNRNGEGGGPRTRLRDHLRRAILTALYGPVPVASPPAPLAVDVRHLAGSYAGGLYCHTCYEGEGWGPPPYQPVIAAGPGVLQAGTQRWLAVDSLLFVNERNPDRRLVFLRDASGRIGWAAEGDRPALERLDDRLLDEVVGPAWRDSLTHPLVARVYRDTEQWAACAAAYGAILRVRPDNGRSAFFGGRCAVNAGDPAHAERLLGTAWTLNQWRNHTAFHLGQSHALAGRPDSALTWLERAVDLQLPNPRRITSDTLLATLRNHPRFQALVSRLSP